MSIKVIIVDDSNFMRRAIEKLLKTDREIEVAGLLSSGEAAVNSIPVLLPDVVLMDVEMGGINGITALHKIMETRPTPVIMFSAYTKKGAEITLKALHEGAVDFVEKPSGTLSMDLGAVRDELIRKIKIASKVKPRRIVAHSTKVTDYGKELRLAHPDKSVIAIGSSTGGVQALQAVIPRLPKDIPVPVLIVQHMPPMFTRSLAETLNSAGPLRVKEAEAGDILTSGNVYVAPGGLHMSVRGGGKDGIHIHLDKKPEEELLRPSVDVMFRSVAEVYEGNSVGVILTGMGYDGTAGARVMKVKGGKILAQDEESCSVYGMPKTAIEAGVVDLVLPLQEIADQLIKMVT